MAAMVVFLLVFINWDRVLIIVPLEGEDMKVFEKE